MDIIRHTNDAKQAASNRSQQSSATLICDYSENELNQLMLNTSEAMAMESAAQGWESRKLETSAGKKVGAYGTDRGSTSNNNESAEKYNLLTRLNDEEENVDFMQMFTQYHMQRQHQQNQQMPLAHAGGTQSTAAGASHQVQYYN